MVTPGKLRDGQRRRQRDRQAERQAENLQTDSSRATVWSVAKLEAGGGASLLPDSHLCRTHTL